MAHDVNKEFEEKKRMREEICEQIRRRAGGKISKVFVEEVETQNFLIMKTTKVTKRYLLILNTRKFQTVEESEPAAVKALKFGPRVTVNILGGGKFRVHEEWANIRTYDYDIEIDHNAKVKLIPWAPRPLKK